jgi:hypothetical protein
MQPPMPNWCWNELLVRGEPPLLDELMAATLTEEQDPGTRFSSWLLEFEDFEMDCEDSVKRSMPWELRLGFVSRNSPPLDFLKALSARYPDLWFGLRYDEPSNEVFGAVACRSGTILDDDFSSAS